jgi:hypothetical protein
VKTGARATRDLASLDYAQTGRELHFISKIPHLQDLLSTLGCA